MNATETFIGVVRKARFHGVQRFEDGVRLTTISMQEGISPEAREISLESRDGAAIMVRGHDGGNWIYEAELIDEAGPIVAELVERVYGFSANATSPKSEA